MEGGESMWATPEDVIGRWIGSGAPDSESETLATLIEDAEDEILREFPGIQSRVEDGSLPVTRIKRVLAGVVIRAYKVAQNPYSNFSESTGPFSHSATIGEGTPRGVQLTSEEKAALAPARKAAKVFQSSMAVNAHSHDISDLEPFFFGGRWRI